MSEKEKKAIERLKDLISKARVIEDIEINKYVAFKDIEIILNLIDKQQKELEILKAKKLEKQCIYGKEVKINNIPEKFENSVISIYETHENCISKEKIREKIERLKILAEKSETEEDLIAYKNKIHILESLLED